MQNLTPEAIAAAEVMARKAKLASLKGTAITTAKVVGLIATGVVAHIAVEKYRSRNANNAQALLAQ